MGQGAGRGCLATRRSCRGRCRSRRGSGASIVAAAGDRRHRLQRAGRLGFAQSANLEGRDPRRSGGSGRLSVPGVEVYENLAIAQLENAQGRWGNLKVYYPATTIWSDHPAVLLQGAWVTDAQKKAARKYLAFLRSRPQQEQGLRYGFRPADTSIPLKSADIQNPFTRLAQYGINVDIPPAAATPSGPVVRNLGMMWSRVVTNR